MVALARHSSEVKHNNGGAMVHASSWYVGLAATCIMTDSVQPDDTQLLFYPCPACRAHVHDAPSDCLDLLEVFQTLVSVVSSSPAAVELINKFAPTVQVSALLVVGCWWWVAGHDGDANTRPQIALTFYNTYPRVVPTAALTPAACIERWLPG